MPVPLCTTAWSDLTVRQAEDHLKTNLFKSPLQPVEQADPVDFRHQLLLLVLGKAKEGEDSPLLVAGKPGFVKAFQGTSLLVCKGLVSC